MLDRSGIYLSIILLGICLVLQGCLDDGREARELRSRVNQLESKNEKLEEEIVSLRAENNRLRDEQGRSMSELRTVESAKHTWQTFFLLSFFGIVIGMSVGMALGSRARQHAERPPRNFAPEAEKPIEPTA